MSVKIRYKDVAVGADSDATVSTSSKTAFSAIEKIPFGVSSPALATCELNGWGLTHDYKVREADRQVAFWSSIASKVDCTFSENPTITLKFSRQITTTGITIMFDENSNDYCTGVILEWYQGGVYKDFIVDIPTSALYTLNYTVEAFDEIRITFASTSLPRKRCKVEGITIGVIREFGMKELVSVKAIHEIDLISDTVPINVLDATIHSRDDVEWLFQKKQPVEAFADGNLIGTYYIEKGEQNSLKDVSISCKDIISLLELKTTRGGLWLADTPLTTILSEIFGEDAVFEIDNAYANSTLRGYLAEMNKREALQHICFALGAVVDTSGTSAVKIFPPSYSIAEDIVPRDTYEGGKVTTSDTVTAVEVTAFDIVDERPGTNDESIEYNKVQYKCKSEVKRVENPDVVTSDIENVKKFDMCYLVNSSNALTLANNIMSYYKKRRKYDFKHVLRGEQVGGGYSVHLPWGGTTNGNITKMTVTTSNLTVSDAEMILNE